MTFVATQVSDGGLWHAGQGYRGGYAVTLCGRRGWVDHRADGAPLPATFDDDPALSQPVECLRCVHVHASHSTEWWESLAGNRDA